MSFSSRMFSPGGKLRWLCVPGLASAAFAADATLSFNRDVRPLLSDRCFHCHGPDGANRKAELRLDIREENTIAVLSPGNAGASDLLKRIFSQDDDEVMPPRDSHLSLSVGEKNLLRRWVEEGAVYQPHWSLIPLPARVDLPAVKLAGGPGTELDRFVLARLERENLTPAPAATRERWLRRVTFDLTGLPPTQSELDAFLSDPHSTAFEHVVDRLLASPRFGERMAVPWLDVARYADSFGYQSDTDTEAWPYRDWVVRALNSNLPWDAFITWQLAGDLLPNATLDQRLATAFNRIHRKTEEGGSIAEEFRQDGISDRVHTFGTAFLGLTLECARCHDHKYDPITARDYYSLGAFFNSIDEFGLLQGGDNRSRTVPQPAMFLPTATQEETLARSSAAIVAAEDRWRDRVQASEREFEAWLNRRPAAALPDQAAHYAFDAAEDGKHRNAVDGELSARTSGGHEPIAGPRGAGLRCNGDDPLALPGFGIAHCHDPVSFALWLEPAESYDRAVVLANTSSFDTNYNGYELLLEEGRLRWTFMREFPGSAISVRTSGLLPTGQWSHVVVTYDGSSRAAGLKIYVNGVPAPVEIVRDELKRDIRIGKGIEVGARMRDKGLRGGGVDELRVFTRAITAIEAAHLHDGRALSALLQATSFEPRQRMQLRDYFNSAIDREARERAEAVRSARRAWRTTMDGVREISVMAELPAPRSAHILQRGAYDQPGEPVSRETLSALPPMPADFPRNRLGLARWLTLPDHPLTSRVLMNRLWGQFFGRGIVASVENFGAQGDLPTHPELLDWLARDFIASGWDFKRACRQIVLSATYRQDSRASRELRERDPENKLLARGPARRLSAEMLRDAALAVGGILSPEVGGAPVKPYQPEGSMWRALNSFLPEYERDSGSALHRRSLYTFWRRTTPPPNMLLFDAVSRDVCAARRQDTSTPLQALVLLNDPQYVEAARFLGERMLREGGGTVRSRVSWAFREVAAREATSQEQTILEALLEEQARLFAERPAEAAKLLKVGDMPSRAGASPAEVAAATTFAGALLNLDAAVMLR